MAITATTVLSESGTGASSYTTTATLSPTENHLYIGVVFGDLASGVAGISGCGLNWVNVTSRVEGTFKMFVFRAMKSSGLTTDHLTVTFGGVVQSNLGVAILDFGGVNTGGTDGSSAVVQYAVQSSNNSGNIGATLAAFADATHNAAFLAAFHNSHDPSIPESGYTQFCDFAVGSGQLAVEWKIGEDTGPLYSWSGTWATIGIALEIGALPAGSARSITIGLATETETLFPIVPVKSGSPTADAAGLAVTTRGGMVKRVGHKLGLAYDVSGEEQTLLRDLFYEGIIEVLLSTHAYVQEGSTALTAGQAEYRLDPNILAIDNGKGQTPAGIGNYDLITMEEMFELQSTGYVSTGFRKQLAIEGNFLVVSPTPANSETLTFLYVPKPTKAVDDNSDLTDPDYGGLPIFAARAVEYYMLWQAGEDDSKTPTSGSDMGPKDYENQFRVECALIRKRKREMRSRYLVTPQVGYPSRRRPFPGRNDVYPC